jgi:F-type H+-transporting ATPase subunit c
MTGQDWLSTISILTAGFTMSVGSIAPALGEARALAQALDSMARQPSEADRITRTLFVGLAMVESTAIYCLVIALLVLFANPFIAAQ